MYQRILIATDGSELSFKAAEDGIELARLSGGRVIALQVVPRYPVSYFEGGSSVPDSEIARIEKQWSEGAQATVEQVKAQAFTDATVIKFTEGNLVAGEPDADVIEELSFQALRHPTYGFTVQIDRFPNP